MIIKPLTTRHWRCDGAKRHPCPRHHDEHSGQDQGTGQEERSGSAHGGPESRALCVPYTRVTDGLSRLITVNRNRCSTALTCLCHVVPKL